MNLKETNPPPVNLQFWPAGSDFTMDDLITNFQYFEPVSAFRTKYDYDNILYMVAGEFHRGQHRGEVLTWRPTYH